MANEVAPIPEGAARPEQEQAAGAGALRGLRESGKLGVYLWPALLIVSFFALWQLLSEVGFFDEIVVPAPTAVVSAGAELVQEDFYWRATWVTAQEALFGFAAGVTLAWILGTLIGLFRIMRLAAYPLIVMFQIMPRVALAPLFITWLGFGISSKIWMAAAICFFPVLINVVLGIDNVDSNARALMRSFGASKWEEYFKLTLPDSLPAIFAGLKVAITLALIGAVVGEFVGATEGLAVLLKTFYFQLNVAEGFVVLFTLAGMGLILYGVTVLLEKRIVFWRGH